MVASPNKGTGFLGVLSPYPDPLLYFRKLKNSSEGDEGRFMRPLESQGLAEKTVFRAAYTAQPYPAGNARRSNLAARHKEHADIVHLGGQAQDLPLGNCGI